MVPRNSKLCAIFYLHVINNFGFCNLLKCPFIQKYSSFGFLIKYLQGWISNKLNHVGVYQALKWFM